MNYSKIKTLTGVPLTDALREMQAVLPPAAYKSVPGAGVDLTDTDPAYLTEKVTELFGACGIGWWYVVNPEFIHVHTVDRQKSGGRGSYQTWEATIAQLRLYYAYHEEGGLVKESRAIIANGGSDNKNRVFAERGALTNALGAAWAKLLWQLPIYKGIVSHKNAASFKVGEVPTELQAAGERKAAAAKVNKPAAQANGGAPGEYVIPQAFCVRKHRGKKLKELSPQALTYYATGFTPPEGDEVAHEVQAQAQAQLLSTRSAV